MMAKINNKCFFVEFSKKHDKIPLQPAIDYV